MVTYLVNYPHVTNIPYAKEIFRTSNYHPVNAGERKTPQETDRDQLCSKRDRRDNGGI
ncbi:hypothetical protein GCM10023084_08560 [Streptomyces lacrimifluminis]